MKKHSVSYKKDIQPSLKNMFYVFKDLLKKCIQDYDKEILETKFSDEKYISFAVFKKKWSERFGKDRDAVKNFGPSICWHIIRTYIKGWNNDSYLTPDDYEALGRNYLTVSIDTFKKVYDVAPMSVGLSMFKDAKLDELTNIYSKAGTTEKDKVYELLYPIYHQTNVLMNNRN